MTTKHEVIAAHRANPAATSVDIARQLGCRDEYVRATFYRNGLTLPPPSYRPNPRNTISALGRAARQAGLTVEDIEKWKAGKAQQ